MAVRETSIEAYQKILKEGFHKLIKNQTSSGQLVIVLNIFKI